MKTKERIFERVEGVCQARGLVLHAGLALILALAGCQGNLPGGRPSDGGGGDSESLDATGVVSCALVTKALAAGTLGCFSALTSHQGTLYASAYESAFGDLVLVSAKASAPDKQTRELVDGVPATTSDTDPTCWRGGLMDRGPDVGLHTSIAVTASGALMISYHDRTNRALKLAVRQGGKWSVHTVEAPKGAAETVGLSTSLVMTKSGPAVAYLALGVDGKGGLSSELRWAEAKKAAPAGPKDWTVTAVHRQPMSCKNLCPKGRACVVKAGGGSACEAVGTGCGACAAGKKCVGGACAAVVADTKLDALPGAAGWWARALITAAGPLVVYHDSWAGKLWVAARDKGWSMTAVAGGATDRQGAHCSAAQDPAGTAVHVAYQDTGMATLRYLQLDPTTLKVTAREVIDDGARPGGLHRVGGDSAVLVDAAGAVSVIYQDSHTADLLLARRIKAGSWTPNKAADPALGRALLSDADAHGFYSGLTAEGGKAYGSTFYYKAASGGALKLLALPAK